MTYERAMKLLLVSFDSTIKANLSMDLPLDFQFYRTDDLKVEYEGRIEARDPYYVEVSDNWGDALKHAFMELLEYKFD